MIAVLEEKCSELFCKGDCQISLCNDVTMVGCDVEGESDARPASSELEVCGCTCIRSRLGTPPRQYVLEGVGRNPHDRHAQARIVQVRNMPHYSKGSLSERLHVNVHRAPGSNATTTTRQPNQAQRPGRRPAPRCPERGVVARIRRCDGACHSCTGWGELLVIQSGVLGALVGGGRVRCANAGTRGQKARRS